MSYVLAALGFIALIVLHELGHFTAAKAVGMRVERFALFFPPILAKVKRGETEYGIGALPFGGYVRITGMTPHEEIPPEIEHRAYYRQAPWRRIVVIAAGPFVNLLLAFLILWAIFMANGTTSVSKEVAKIEPGSPAARVLERGDRIVGVDGVHGDQEALAKQIATHTCAGKPTDGCRAQEPARITVIRDGERRTFEVRPRYDAQLDKPRVGFAFGLDHRAAGPARAAYLGGDEMWNVTTGTVSAIAKVFTPERKELSGIVGSYEVAQESFAFSTTRALEVLAIISLSLAIVNLFPFLPLDGGHIFWAVAEKVRRRPVPFWVMERAGVVGFVLVAFLFIVGLTNDIGRLQGEGFGVR